MIRVFSTQKFKCKYLFQKHVQGLRTLTSKIYQKYAQISKEKLIIIFQNGNWSYHFQGKALIPEAKYCQYFKRMIISAIYVHCCNKCLLMNYLDV